MKSWLDWRWPRGGIAFISITFILGGLGFLITGGFSWYTRWVCPWFLAVGAGLWLKHSWARWTTFAFLAIIACVQVEILFVEKLTLRNVATLLVVGGSLLSLWQWDVYPEHKNFLSVDDDDDDEDEDIDWVARWQTVLDKIDRERQSKGGQTE